MKYILILSLFVVSGCIPKGLVKAQVAEEIKVADKITGVESLKMADDLQAENMMGSNQKIEKNQTSTSVGGDMSTSNDSEVIKDMIEANKELSEKILDTHLKAKKSSDWLYRGIIGALILLIGDFRIQVAKNTGRLLKMIEKDAEAEEKRIAKLIDNVLNKKEA